MTRFRPIDVTDKAYEISKVFPAKRTTEDEGFPITPKERIPLPNSIDPYNEYHKKVYIPKRSIEYILEKQFLILLM